MLRYSLQSEKQAAVFTTFLATKKGIQHLVRGDFFLFLFFAVLGIELRVLSYIPGPFTKFILSQGH